jgi:hypothetical protein
MKRRNFKAIVTDASGDTIIGETNTFAWNSAIRASEAIVRENARSQYSIYHGAKPVVMDEPERIYRRYWTTSSGRQVTALVWEVV